MGDGTPEARKDIWVILSEKIDPRLIYLLVAIALAIPLTLGAKLPPAQMTAAEAFYAEVEKLKPGPDNLVLVAMDWGPGTSAENGPQTRVAIEHLLRKRIPFAVISLYALAAPMLKQVPLEVVADLEKETGEKWVYGEDWVNLGYQPQSSLFIRSFAASKDLHELLKTDATGTPIGEVPVMKNIRTPEKVQMLMEFTGLVGVFNNWLQFFRSERFKPAFVHGCTSITIPDAYLFYSSKQIVGFFEGVAGAAWYDRLLEKKYPARKFDYAIQVNSGLAFAQLIILALIVLGNVGYFMAKRSRSRPTGSGGVGTASGVKGGAA